MGSKMEGRRGLNRGMQTMLLLLAMVATMAVALLYEVSPFAPSRVIVLDSPVRSHAESETTPNNQSSPDLPLRQITTEMIVQEKEPTSSAEADENSPANSTQSLPNSTDVAESPDNATSRSSSNLKLDSNSTMQREDLTDTVEMVAGQGSDSEKHSNTDQNLPTVNTVGDPKLSDKVQNPDDGRGSEEEKSMFLTAIAASFPSFPDPDNSVREATENRDSALEHGDAEFKAGVENEAHDKKSEVECDYTVGKWVLDKTRPLYSGRECPLWLSPDWACRLHNHPDKLMDKYRWQPAGCNLPVFNASATLEMLRNKVVAFVGDSLGRQQWQSLLCMLTHGRNATTVTDAASTFKFYTPRGARRPTGWANYFKATNTTIVYKWSVTLARIQALSKSTNALHLDQPELFLSDHLHNLDIVILNSGHHWNNGKMQQNGYNFYTQGQPLTKTSVRGAYNQTIHNIVKWVDEKTRNSTKVVYYRSLSPRHFRNGDWNTGGTCDAIRFEEGKVMQEGVKVDVNAESAVKGTRVKLLNITALSMERGDTHVSKYGRGKDGQDCLHWCLPGVPDTWNEIMLAELRETMR